MELRIKAMKKEIVADYRRERSRLSFRIYLIRVLSQGRQRNRDAYRSVRKV